MQNHGSQTAGAVVESTEPEGGLLLAATRLTTGANAHRMRNLVQAYTLACEAGHTRYIASTKRDLAEYLFSLLNISIKPVP